MQAIINNLESELRRNKLLLTSLLKITQAINTNRNAAELFQIYEFILTSYLGFDKILLYHTDINWEAVLHRNVDSHVLQKLNVNKLLAPHTEVTLCNDLDTELLMDFHYLIPVIHKERPLAYLLLGNIETANTELTKDEIGFLQTITNIIVVAIENKRLFKQQLEQESLKKDLEVAEQIQNMLIANQLPNNDKVKMMAIYKPHSTIGGDYYDYIQLNQDEFLLCMADVTGKGIGAALLMSNLQALVRAIARESSSLVYLVKRLNELLYDLTGGDRFVTFFVCRYNTQTRILTYINAGHNPPILTTTESLELLAKGSTLLGVFDRLPKIVETTLYVPFTSQLLIYTDGLTDIENDKGENLGIDRVENFAKQHQSTPITEFKSLFTQYFSNFKGKVNYTDDISILVCRFV